MTSKTKLVWTAEEIFNNEYKPFGRTPDDISKAKNKKFLYADEVERIIKDLWEMRIQTTDKIIFMCKFKAELLRRLK